MSKKELIDLTDQSVVVTYEAGEEELRTSFGDSVLKLEGVDGYWLTPDELEMLADEIYSLAKRRKKKDDYYKSRSVKVRGENFRF